MVPPTGRRAGYQEGIRADIIRLSCALPEVLLAHEHLADNVLAQWGEVLIKAHRSRRFWRGVDWRGKVCLGKVCAGHGVKRQRTAL